MEYSTYVRKATLFINENYGGLEVLKIHNPSVEDELRKYMYKVVQAEYTEDPKKGIRINQEFGTRFINSQRG